MNRIVSLVVVLLVAISLFATDRVSRKPMFIATTGRIIKINAKARTMIVQGSAGLAVRTSDVACRDEYTVVTSSDTIFQDGGDSIRFDDFKNNDMISIQGLLTGTTLTASRVAKWD
jgi:hypothetical protein